MNKETDFCLKCPISQKIASYQEAALNGLLAHRLADRQRIPGHPTDVLQTHYLRTAETLLEQGCKTGILCRSRR